MENQDGVLLPGQDSYKALYGRSMQQGLHVAKLAQKLCGFIHSANPKYLQDVHWTFTVKSRRKILRLHNRKQNKISSLAGKNQNSPNVHYYGMDSMSHNITILRNTM